MNKKKKITLAVAILLVLCLTVGGALAYLKATTQTVQNTFTMGAVGLTLDEKDITSDDEDARTRQGNQYALEPGKEYVKDPTVTVLKGSEPCYVRMFVKIALPENITLDTLKAAVAAYMQQEPAEAAAVVAALVADGWLDNNAGVITLHTEKLGPYLTGRSSANWSFNGDFYGGAEGDDTGVCVIESRYVPNGGIVPKNTTSDTELPALFKTFIVPKDEEFPTLIAAGLPPMYIINKLIDYYNAANSTQYASWNDFIPTVNIVAQAVQSEGLDNADAAWEAAGVPAGYEHGDTVIPPISFTMPPVGP